MRQVFRKIPVYTGDVSGVCSALYELGGMVVMHDPSGCNSTYNTHDEIRWYDHDSLIFLSGLDEMDAIMGSDDRLIHDIAEAARIYAPAFIAVANSPIPYITGMDFDAICRTVEQETGIPSFYISTNGMHDYVHGAGLALLRVAERFTQRNGIGEESARTEISRMESRRESVPQAESAGTGISRTESRQESVPQAESAGTAVVRSESAGTASGDSDRTRNSGKSRAITCNLLGVTPLDFACGSTLESIFRKLREEDIEVISCWAMEFPAEKTGSGKSMLGQIAQSSRADVNLLLSSVGYPAASFMYEKYGIPFAAGIPAEGAETLFFDAVRRAAQTGENQFPFRERPVSAGNGNGNPETVFCFIGEPVIMESLAAGTAARTGAVTHVFGATEGADLFLGTEDAALRGEEELQEALRREMAKGVSLKVVADPCYLDIIPEGAELVRLPHLAFSGRIFRREIPDLLCVTP
ncbi:MAG: nitrogenase component 1 [Eubacteriales bacterium]|nr:nitrogenase component 1 [Eubacteriales bacterium]